jgi:hypothetical protein
MKIIRNKISSWEPLEIKFVPVKKKKVGKKMFSLGFRIGKKIA